MPRSSGRGGNGRDRGEGDTGRSRGEGDTGRSRGEEDTRRREEEDTRREEKNIFSDGYKPEQFPEGDRSDVSISVGDLSVSGDLYRNTGDGASEIGVRREISYGPAEVVNDISVGAEHQWSDGKYQLGADAEIKTEANIGLVGLGQNARANVGVHAADGRYQAGAEASVNSELKLGNSNETGNEVALGVGVGVGVGGEAIIGADADRDGQEEFGTSFSFKWGIGFSIGFRVEPEAVTNRMRELLGSPTKNGREIPREEETHNCIERIHELLSSLEMRRTKEAYARLQSVLSG